MAGRHLGTWTHSARRASVWCGAVYTDSRLAAGRLAERGRGAGAGGHGLARVSWSRPRINVVAPARARQAGGGHLVCFLCKSSPNTGKQPKRGRPGQMQRADLPAQLG